MIRFVMSAEHPVHHPVTSRYVNKNKGFGVAAKSFFIARHLSPVSGLVSR
ncbi:hypothetical protein L579_3591 [Pantoea sp. AS-PWVM4]|nr:hypothetical protein L579_3591 [Pantoea sp. AS-PWVM4]